MTDKSGSEIEDNVEKLPYFYKYSKHPKTA